MESSGSNSYQLTDCQSSSNTESLVTKEFEIVRYDISGLPKEYQANAKLQLLGKSFVKLTPLSALVHKKQNVISSVEPLAMHSDLAKKPILNTFIDNSKRCVKNVGTQTEPLNIGTLERRITQIEKMSYLKPSLRMPSPLLPKSQEYVGSALSTPPNSDSGSCTGHVDKKSETSSSKNNPTPPALHIVENDLTNNDLRQCVVGLNSSVSPPEETRKKRPCLGSLSDYEQRSSKKEKKMKESMCQLQEPEQIKEISSIREKYIPIIMNDQNYEPKSSIPRDIVKGIRPLHQPNRRIEDDKLKTLIQDRGGTLSYSSVYSSDSDDATSANESSEEINTNEHSEKTSNEIFPPAKLCLTVEKESIVNDSSIIPEELSSKPTAPESVESTMSLSSTNSGEFYTTSSAIEPVSVISVAVISDSTRENISPAVTEEHTPAVIPKKLPLPSLAVPPSPRRQTPEPISQVPSSVVNAKSSIPMEEDESDEEFVLNICLDEEEFQSPFTIPMDDPIRNMPYAPTTPPVTHSNRYPRETLAIPVPHENGIGPGSSSSVPHEELNPEPPSHVLSPVETKKAAPYVELEIPKQKDRRKVKERKKKDGETTTRKGDGKFKCNFCAYSSPIRNNLIRHIRTHTGEKPYLCKLCDKRYSHTHTLKGHMLTHAKELPFKCAECKYAVAYSSDLKQHQRTHTGEKPFACEICSKLFSRKQNLNRHKLTHGGSQPSGSGMSKSFVKSPPRKNKSLVKDLPMPSVVSGNEFLIPVMIEIPPTSNVDVSQPSGSGMSKSFVNSPPRKNKSLVKDLQYPNSIITVEKALATKSTTNLPNN